MRILVVGASGTIGRAVTAALEPRHEVITAGRESGDVRVDIASQDSIRAAYEQVGALDAVVCAAGKVTWAHFDDLRPKDYLVGLENKLMGQVNLVLLGRDVVRERGSFTLTTGVLDRDPIPEGVSASMVNGGVNAFVMAASICLPRQQRINVVSPGLIEESVPAIGSFFPGADTIAAADAARAYVKSVEGAQTGQVYEVP